MTQLGWEELFSSAFCARLGECSWRSPRRTGAEQPGESDGKPLMPATSGLVELVWIRGLGVPLPTSTRTES